MSPARVLTEQVGVKLTPEEKAELVRRAKEADRTPCAEARRAIRRYLRETEPKTEDAA